MQLTDILKNFIEQKDTDFAILINGAWGSGKTFYLKNEVANTIQSIHCPLGDNKTKPYEMVYVSLYGITNADELQKRLFLEINPRLKTKVGRIGASVIAKGLQFIGFDMSEKDEKDLINIFGGIPKNKVLVFDDLERLETGTLNEVLGFINAYTEHQHLKVIIIADEEKIQKKLPDYDSIKEKLIRFTYIYNPSLVEVFPSFVARYETALYKQFLTERMQLICTLFEKGAHKNLRSLRFVLDLFEPLVKALLANTNIETDARNIILDRFLYFFITYSIATKKGATPEALNALESLSSDFDDPLNRTWFNSLAKDMEGVEQLEPTDLEQFTQDFEKAFITDAGSEFQYFPFLVHYIHSGDLSLPDVTAAAEVMQQKITDKRQKPEQIAADKLKNCLVLNDNEFTPLVQEIVGYVQQGVYPLQDYPLLFQQLQVLSSHGMDHLTIDDATVDLFKEGMSRAVARAHYQPGFDSHTRFHHGEDELLLDVRQFASELNNRLLSTGDKVIAENIVQLLTAEDFGALNELLQSKAVQSNPVFQSTFIEPAPFFTRFLQLSNNSKMEVLNMLEQFSHRFVYYAAGLKKETDFFLALRTLVEEEIGRAAGNFQISTGILLRFKSFLQAALDRLQAA